MEKNNTPAVKFNFTNSRFVPDDASKGLFTFLILQTLVTLVYNVLYMVGLVQSIWSYVFTLILDFCFVACVFNIAKTKKIDVFANLKMKKAPSFKQVLICVGISVVCLFGFSALTNLFLEVLYSMGYESVTSDIVISNFGTYLMYVGLICIIPALCEEILFRGLICNGLKRLGSVVAIFGSAFLFMIMHGSPDQTIHQFILGIVLAIVYLVSNNLWIPIIIHFLNNFMAVTISYIAYGDTASTATESVGMVFGEYLIYALISALIAGAIIYVLIRALSRSYNAEKDVEPVELKSITAPLQDGYISYTNYNYAQESTFGVQQDLELNEMQNESNSQNADVYVDPVFSIDENKMSGGGKAMLIISIVWLAIDWISALIIGFSGMY